MLLAFGPLVHQIHDDGRGGNHTLIGCGRHSGIFKQRLVIAEHQIQERLLGVDTTGLAQNVEVFVIFMHLPVRDGEAVGSPVSQGSAKRARLKHRSGVVRGVSACRHK